MRTIAILATAALALTLSAATPSERLERHSADLAERRAELQAVQEDITAAISRVGGVDRGVRMLQERAAQLQQQIESMEVVGQILAEKVKAQAAEHSATAAAAADEPTALSQLRSVDRQLADIRAELQAVTDRLAARSRPLAEQRRELYRLAVLEWAAASKLQPIQRHDGWTPAQLGRVNAKIVEVLTAIELAKAGDPDGMSRLPIAMTVMDGIADELEEATGIVFPAELLP